MSGESLLSIYARARAFVVTATVAFALLVALSVGVLYWQGRQHLRHEAELVRTQFQERVTHTVAAMTRGLSLEVETASRFAVDADHRMRRARPAWLNGVRVRGSALTRAASSLQVGEYTLLFAPDFADMVQRLMVVVRTAEGLEVASFWPGQFLTAHTSHDLIVLDRRGRCRYSTHREDLGALFAPDGLRLTDRRVLLEAALPLERTGGLQLVVAQDVTGQSWVVLGALLLGAAAVTLSRWRARALDRDLAALERETGDVTRVIETLSSVPLNGAGEAREASAEADAEGGLTAALAAARTLRPRFAENHLNLELLCALAQSVGGLLAQVRRDGEDLRESEGRLRRALMDAPLPAVLHAEDGEVLLVNRAWVELTGYDDQELPAIADWVMRMHGPERVAEVRGFVAGLFEVEERREHGEFTVRTAHGTRRTWDFRSAPLGRLADGRRVALTMAIDVTERRLMEARLRQSEKLEAIGELAGGVAHDFNNQLTGILGLAELVARDPGASPEAVEAAHAIRTAAQRSAELTGQLLAFARRGKHLAVEVDLHALVGEVVTLLERSLDKRIHLRRDLAATHPVTRGDPTQLQSALLNLAINARDAMPDGGELTIATRDEQVERNEGLAPGRYVELSVSDTGGGIPRELHLRVFEPFFTTKPEGKGTGMGLAAVYGTVQAHQGRIDLDSRPGEGSTFRIVLPAVAAEAAAPVAAACGPSPAGLRVLVVDDEPVVRRTIERQLSALGHVAVGTCGRGAAAVAWLREHADQADVAVLDLGLPDIDGGALVHELRSERADLPVVLVSGFAMNERAQEAIGAGGAAFLEKPFTLGELGAALGRAVGAVPTAR